MYHASDTACADNSRVALAKSHYHSDRKRGYYKGLCCNPGRRLVLKNGQINTIPRHIPNHRFLMLQSLFATLVDMQWRWILLILTLTFFLSWLGFALIWWLIALVHGDLEPQHLPHNQEAVNWIPCVTGILGFTSSFLFSMENQHTTGFGTRMPTEECPEGIFIMCIQAIIGLTIQTAMVGVVLAKMARSKQRANTILFSEKAVICRRDNGLCLMIRVGDLQKSNIIEAKLTLQFIVTNPTMVDEVLSPFRCELKINKSKPHFYLMWPELVIHFIDKDSPLFDFCAEEMQQARFEIVAVLEGTLECTDQRVQARTSYIPSEILWGYRFQPMISYSEEVNSYELDFKLFHSVVVAGDMPTCSAKDVTLFEDQAQDRDKIIQSVKAPESQVSPYLLDDTARSSCSV